MRVHARDAEAGQAQHRSMQDFVAHGEAHRFVGLRRVRRSGFFRGAASSAAAARRFRFGLAACAVCGPRLSRHASRHGVFDRLGAQRLHPGAEDFERDHLLGLEPAPGVLAFDDLEVRRGFDELVEPVIEALLGELADAPRRHDQQRHEHHDHDDYLFHSCLPKKPDRDSCASSAASRSVVPMSYHRP